MQTARIPRGEGLVGTTLSGYHGLPLQPGAPLIPTLSPGGWVTLGWITADSSSKFCMCDTERPKGMTRHMSPTHSSTLRQLLGDSTAKQVTDEIEPQSRYVQFEVLLNAEEFNLSRLRRLFVLQFYLELDEPFCTDEQRHSATSELLDYVLDFEVDWKHHE